MLGWFRKLLEPKQIPGPTDLPEPPRSLEELADEYIALMGPYERSEREVEDLKIRLGKLMLKHDIPFIARKDTLIKQGYWRDVPYASMYPLARIGDAPRIDDSATHLIPLVDRLLEADGDYGKNWARRREVGKLVAEAMQRRGFNDDDTSLLLIMERNKPNFVYRGYRFELWYKNVSVERVADLDG